MDLTKYLKKDVLYNDLGFNTGKSTQDLINEMQAQGLLLARMLGDMWRISQRRKHEVGRSMGVLAAYGIAG